MSDPGPGKYGALLQASLEVVGASQGVLIVFDGPMGPGSTLHVIPDNYGEVIRVLRMMADDLEKNVGPDHTING